MVVYPALDDRRVLRVDIRVKDVVVVHIKEYLHLVAKARGSARVDTGDEVVLTVDEVQEDFIAHQFGDVHFDIDWLGDDAGRRVKWIVDIFGADAENDIFIENMAVALLVFIRQLDAE